MRVARGNECKSIIMRVLCGMRGYAPGYARMVSCWFSVVSEVLASRLIRNEEWHRRRSWRYPVWPNLAVSGCADDGAFRGKNDVRLNRSFVAERADGVVA